ncbi:hypothetical protein GWK41_06150 [Persephonella atlantica]|uniref:Uncharacterized protein n=1 Tax=Persephonella atlantica TaxID=2699429 RepID=A0ABS1GI79_9AQUI|nr:hypothetical protein [Persephonella atlantica]MBK3332644.1 hypothetical protein [Persephonella atlantica]
MDKRLLELIYMDYINSIENPVEINIEQILRDEIKEKILNKFKTPVKTKKAEFPLEQGNIYLFFKKQIPIYYLIIDRIDGLYEVLKVSNYWELANQNDFIIKVDDEMFAIETWNNFYLTEEEVKKSMYIGKLSEEDFKILTDYISGKISELPQNKRGLTVPISENFYQIKFHQKESEIVREYKLRVFEEEENVIQISPEREKEILIPLVAGREKTVFSCDKFLLKKLPEENLIQVIFSPEIQGKKAVITIFDEQYEFFKLPETIYIESSNVEKIDLEKLCSAVEVSIELD